MGCPSLVLQLLSCGFVSVLSSSAFVVSYSPIILFLCVTFHCLIILLMLGALIGNKEFVCCIIVFAFVVIVTIHIHRLSMYNGCSDCYVERNVMINSKRSVCLQFIAELHKAFL